MNTITIIDTAVTRPHAQTVVLEVTGDASGRVVQFTVTRDFYARQSHAVAKLLARDGKWTVVLRADPADWHGTVGLMSTPAERAAADAVVAGLVGRLENVLYPTRYATTVIGGDEVTVRVMAVAGGWAMVRRPRAAPILVRVSELRELPHD